MARLEQPATLAIPHILKIVGLVVFAQTLFTRAVDPVIPKIALDLAIEVQTAALLSTAFTFPYALVQPILGVTADFLGKTRLMNVCVFVVAVSSLVCAFAESFTLLVAMRILSGLVAGGVFPVAMALIGDLVPIQRRQVAIARLLGVALTANVLGATISGFIGDWFGWRGVFLILGLFALAAAVLAFLALRRIEIPPPKRFSRTAVVANFRSIFADPRAKVCFSSVFLEAIFIHGLFPFVGLLLIGIGETRASIAGLLIASFAIGGVGYSLFIPYVLGRVPEQRLMVVGGAAASCALAFIAMSFPWQAQIPIFLIFGGGFYLLHGCIQLHVTDLSHTARGAATSLHSSSFYMGQAVGPLIYGFGIAHGGAEPMLLIGAIVVLGVGLVCARLLPAGRRI
jgi:predicted MFS family arabinose efflux permease